MCTLANNGYSLQLLHVRGQWGRASSHRGEVYAIPTRSAVLMLGDSWANEIWTSLNFGDFPWQTRRALGNAPVAVNAYGASGHRIDQITAQVASGGYTGTPRLRGRPYTLCVAHGGTNDIVQNKTLAEMQDRTARTDRRD